MKQLRVIWCTEGRPRENDIHNDAYSNHKAAKARFRRLHRKHVAKYMSQLDSELDRTAERDYYRFWRMVKSRRKNTSENLGSGIKFNGVTVRDRHTSLITGDSISNHYIPLLRV